MSAKTKPLPPAGANSKPKPASKPALATAPPSSIFGMLDDIKGLDSRPTTARVSDLVPDPAQDRKYFDPEELSNLAAALLEVGFLQPILVSPTGGTPPWKIVDGERRWRAAQLAELEEVPIHVREDMDDANEMRHLAQMIANASRSDLRDYEMAKAIQRELDKLGNKRGDRARLAKLLNRPQAAISRYLSMLDPEFEPLVREGKILNADVLARFKSLDPELRDQLLAELPPDKLITDAMCREISRKASEAPATAEGGETAVPPDDLPPASSETGLTSTGPSDSDLASAAQVLADGAGGGTEAGSSEGLEPGAKPTSLDAQPGMTAGSDTGVGHGEAGASDEEENERGAGGGGTVGDAGRSNSSGSARGAGAPREKSVQLATTAERIEQLLRYFVDKSTDRVELRVPGDLAIAIIENLGGEVPDDKDRYAGLIMELLDAKLG
jgi:ParB/RepB/Spo0J family partition protein